MEWVAIFLLTVIGMGTTINNNEAEIQDLTAQIEKLDRDFLRLAGAHAAVAARETVINEGQQDQIDEIIRQMNEE